MLLLYFFDWFVGLWVRVLHLLLEQHLMFRVCSLLVFDLLDFTDKLRVNLHVRRNHCSIDTLLSLIVVEVEYALAKLVEFWVLLRQFDRFRFYYVNLGTIEVLHIITKILKLLHLSVLLSDLFSIVEFFPTRGTTIVIVRELGNTIQILLTLIE